MINKIRYILKVYKTSKKNKFVLFLLGCFMTFILSGSLILLSGRFYESVNLCREKYGTFGCWVNGNSDDTYQKLKKNKIVEDIYQCKTKQIDVDKKEEGEEFTEYYYLHYGKENYLDMLGLHLQEGKFPSKEKEILIDSGYMDNRKWDNSIIGQQVEIPENSKEKYIVSGIVKKETVFREEEPYEFEFFIYEENPKTNCLYVTINDYTNLDEELLKIENEIKEEVFVNYDVFAALGYLNEKSLYEKNMQITYYLFFFVTVCICFIIYNLVKMCMYDQMKKISIMNLIGIPKKMYVSLFFWFVIRYVLLGSILGIGTSLGGVALLYYFLHGDNAIFLQVIKELPFETLAETILFCYVVMMMIQIPIIIQLFRLSPNEMMQPSRSSILCTNKKKKGKEKYIFKDKVRFKFVKIAKHYIMQDKCLHLLMVLGNGVGICIIIIGFVFIKLNFPNEIGNQNNAYCFRLYEYYHKSQNIEETEKLYTKNLGFSKDVKLHSLYSNLETVQVKRECLSEKYMEYLFQSGNLSLHDRMNNTKEIEISSVVMGYDEKELEELSKLTKKKDYNNLKNNEAIVLKNTYSSSGIGNLFQNTFRSGDTIKIPTRNVELKVTYITEQLSLFPYRTNRDLILIVNEETFKSIYHEEIPMYVYIKDKIDMKNTQNKRAYEKLDSMRNVVISEPCQEYIQKQNNKQIDKIVIYFIAMITILIAGVLMFSSFFVRLHIKVAEYAMMKAIGIKDSQLKRVICYECGIIFLEIEILAVVISYFLTKHFYVTKYTIEGTYLYQYPLGIALLANGIVFVMFLLIVYLLCKKVQKIVIAKELGAI